MKCLINKNINKSSREMINNFAITFVISRMLINFANPNLREFIWIIKDKKK
jgi:hypothetical protein